MKFALSDIEMSTLENILKTLYTVRPAEYRHVLSPEEMVNYYLWMSSVASDHQQLKSVHNLSADIIIGGNLSSFAGELQNNLINIQSQNRLELLFSSPKETDFFSDNQHIIFSRFLRHLPAYYNRSDFFEIWYVASGKMKAFFPNEEIEILPGQFFIIPPNVKKACTCPFDDTNAYFFSMRKSTFSNVFLNRLPNNNLMTLFFQQAVHNNSNNSYLAFSTEKDKELEGIMERIYRTYRNDSAYSPQIILSMTETLLLILLDKYEHTAKLSKGSNIHFKNSYLTILSDIQNTYATVTIKQLSKKYHYSERQLIRIIKECTDMTFTELILKLRMEKAALLLKSKAAPISEIATEVGYSTVSSFYRAFESYYHCTPGEFQ